jgi:flagellum-specific ATP synthase
MNMRADGFTVAGSIVSVHGNSIMARLPQASLGDLCWITTRTGTPIRGQVVGFQNDLFSLALFEEPSGIAPGLAVRTKLRQLTIPVGPELLGRVINPLGEPIDTTQRPLTVPLSVSLCAKPPRAAARPAIKAALETGVSALDGFCTIGKGQRIAICASAGVGKSSLLAAIARNADADVIVVALVGERGREVREFIDDTLGPAGLARSVIVVATSDDSSLMRQTAPYTATALAEYFRDQGKDVLLIVDSLTRMARAVRETGLGAGELPVRHGYTNSVYTQLPQLLERAGTSERGTITGIYTVLTNQEDDIDPLADEVKSLLDGHINLRQELAASGILPAIDITTSISRLFERVSEPNYIVATRKVRSAVRRLWKERELLMMGGTPDNEMRTILHNQQKLLELITQDLRTPISLATTRERVAAVSQTLATN